MKVRSAAVKRVFDLAVSLAGVVLTLPLLAVTAIAVRISLGKPVLLRQLRPGLNGKPFRLYKFRTMNENRDAAGNLLPDEQRLTKLGSFLRSCSLDELPEMLNVIKGDMSLVGPRPLKMEYLGRYNPTQARRHEVKPGITGWAQVNGRNALTWEQKFALDLWYVENGSFLVDLKILLRTIRIVLRRDGINAVGSATMPEFMGSRQPE